MLTRREIVAPFVLTGAILIPLTCLLHSDQPRIVPFIAVRELFVFVALCVPQMVVLWKIANGLQSTRTIALWLFGAAAAGFVISTGSLWLARSLELGKASPSIAVLYFSPMMFAAQKIVRRRDAAGASKDERAS